MYVLVTNHYGGCGLDVGCGGGGGYGMLSGCCTGR